MREKRRNIKGFTMVEMLIGIGILGIIFSMAPRVLLDTYRFFRVNVARAEVQRDSRSALDLMNRQLRQGYASTVTVSRYNSSQPYYSKVVFNTISTSSVTFWQEGHKLKMQTGSGSARTIAENLRYVAFLFGQSDNDNIMSVSVAFEKAVYGGKSKALQMGVEKVRVMND